MTIFDVKLSMVCKGEFNLKNIFASMTPDKRLDQIEPVMADVLQKVDRLIEGQGQLVEVATRADQNADTAARGIANLTVATQKQFDQVNNRFDQVDDRFNQVDDRFDQVGTQFNQVDTRFDQVGTQFNQVDTRFDQVGTQFNQVNTRFDQVEANQHEMQQDVTDMRQEIADLKAGQELILQILRGKLS